MKRLIVIIICIFIAFSFTAMAKSYELPKDAKKVKPGVYYLGKGIDKKGVVEGYAFMRYDKYAKPPPPVCGNDICEKKEQKNCPSDCQSDNNQSNNGTDIFEFTDPYTVGNPDCYGFMGPKWYDVEPYLVKTRNREGLDPDLIKAAIEFAILEWENAATGSMEDGLSVDVLGDLTGGKVNSADMGNPDGKNELMFGSVSDPGAIAVTIVWATSFEPGGEIVEWDQVYDQNDFDWSLYGEPGKMDFLSIAMHEIGHGFGMDDLYSEACGLETMYGYGSEGETNSRSLAQGDIFGISVLY